MKILAKIRALFNLGGELAEMELSSAEIRRDKIFLHPSNGSIRTFCVNASSVDILINPENVLSEDDVLVLETEELSDGVLQDDEPQQVSIDVDATGRAHPSAIATEPFSPPEPTPEHIGPSEATRTNQSLLPKKKVVTFRLYPEEYDMLMTNIQTNGYRKTEYLLACIAAAKKNSLEATYKRYFAAHKERRRIERAAAKKAEEERCSVH